MQSPSNDLRRDSKVQTFRTLTGVAVMANTIDGGARLYRPLIPSWMMVAHDRAAEWPPKAQKDR